MYNVNCITLFEPTKITTIFLETLYYFCSFSKKTYFVARR